MLLINNKEGGIVDFMACAFCFGRICYSSNRRANIYGMEIQEERK